MHVEVVFVIFQVHVGGNNDTKRQLFVLVYFVFFIIVLVLLLEEIVWLLQGSACEVDQTEGWFELFVGELATVDGIWGLGRLCELLFEGGEIFLDVYFAFCYFVSDARFPQCFLLLSLTILNWIIFLIIFSTVHFNLHCIRLFTLVNFFSLILIIYLTLIWSSNALALIMRHNEGHMHKHNWPHNSQNSDTDACHHPRSWIFVPYISCYFLLVLD